MKEKQPFEPGPSLYYQQAFEKIFHLPWKEAKRLSSEEGEVGDRWRTVFELTSLVKPRPNATKHEAS